MKFKVVAVDAGRHAPTVERDILAKAQAELITAECKSEEDLIKATCDADGILVSLSQITRQVISSWKKNKIIARYGIGVDTVDLQAATDHGVFVTNVPDFCYDEVSDTAISLILSVTRKVVKMHGLVSQGIWDRKLAIPVYKLRGRNLGLIGFGHIAQAVAKKAAPFGLKVSVYDPYVQPSDFVDSSVEFLELHELLRKSDIISIHTPLTKGGTNPTFHLISEPELRMMKPTAFLVNTARGPVVEKQALTKALQEGWIAGAGLDVLEQEPPDPQDPILKLENVVLTPHYASYTEEAYVEVREKAADQIVQVLSGKIPSFLVNKNVLEEES